MSNKPIPRADVERVIGHLHQLARTNEAKAGQATPTEYHVHMARDAACRASTYRAAATLVETLLAGQP